jgi:phosphoenolpyruvate---glycerone phosphotransferase subunit DhaL
MSNNTVQGADVVAAVRRASQMLIDQADYLTSLDQAMGDGDMGITLSKIGAALLETTDANAIDDIGKYLYQLGAAMNKAAPSTMGTLLAGGLMSAGKVVRGKTELTPADLAAIFGAVDEGIRSRGKANLGDKTIVDAMNPASEAFAAAIQGGASIQDAATAAIAAAEAGRDRVTPLRSRVGRASWVGERTEGKLDPGCAMFVLLLEAIAMAP